MFIINLLCVGEVVRFLEKIEHCAAAPGLSFARIAAVGAIVVGEFWETSPRVGLYVTARREDIGVQAVKDVLEILKGCYF